jgi:hypothetical protein
MRTARAAIAGVIGAAVMSLAMAICRLMGVNANLESLIGSVFGVEGSLAWIAGFIVHLTVGAVAAIVYAVGFEYALQRSGPLAGAAFGLAHGLLAGLFMSAIPAMNPLISDPQGAPGPFLNGLAWGPALFLALHVLFGLVVGVVYGPVMHKPHLMSRSRPA